MECVDTVGAFIETSFGFLPAPATCQGAVILGAAKLGAQPLRSGACEEP